MGQLVVIEFPEEHTAFAVRAELSKMQKEYLIKMEDVVVVTKDEKGKVKLHQAVNLTMAGAVGGSFWGMLIGLLFLNPLLGAAVGAGAGALRGKVTDLGIDDTFMKEFAKLHPRCLGPVRAVSRGDGGQGAGAAERLQGQSPEDLSQHGRRGEAAPGPRSLKGTVRCWKN